MSSTRKTILIVISSIILLVVLYFVFGFYKQLKEPVSPVTHAIPPDASIIIETKRITEVWDILQSENDIWKDLCNINALSPLSNILNNVESSINNDGRVAEIINDKIFSISFHTNTSYKTSVLFLLGLSNSRESSYINKFIQSSLHENYSVSTTEAYGAEINRIQQNDNQTDFFYSVSKGILIGSFDEALIKASLDQLNSNTPVTDNIALQKLRNSSGKKVDANIYLNYHNFFRTIGSLYNSTNKEYINALQNIAEWTETDLIIKNDELLFNGFTALNKNATNNYLNLFIGQSPQIISIVDYIPSGTAYFLDLSFGDFGSFYSAYTSYLESNSSLESHQEAIENINTAFAIDLEQSFIPWIDNEIALIITNPEKNKKSENTFAIIKAKDIDKAKIELNNLVAIISNVNETKPYKEEYNGCLIQKLEIPGILPTLLGSQFETAGSSYFTMLNAYVIFANSASSLKQYINKVKMGKTMANNENYVAFSDNISEKSNIYLYCNIRKSLSMIESNSALDVGNFIKNNSSVFSNFEAFSVQFSSNSELFYTNIYLKHNSTYIEEKSSVWEVDLKADVYGKPFLVKDHTDNSTKIIAFDADNNMYLVDQNGNIIWDVQIPEKIMSNLYQVDYYKNGKIQYLFNTRNYVYLIDLKGNKVAKYPVKLPAEATNGIALFDYNNEKDYRILIACNDNRVYNLDINATKVNGWKMKKTSGNVSVPLKHIYSSKKDYIITTEDNGNIHINNRKGIKRIKTITKSNNSLKSDIYLNKTNSRGLFLSTNTDGDLIYITSSGSVKKTNFGDFSGDHYFLYEDLDNDGSTDFIFLDKNQLLVFDRFKKIILSHSFDNNIDIKPVVISLNKNTTLIGVLDSSSEKIYLFSKNGLIENGNDINGSTPFVLTKNGKSEGYYLITGSGHTLFRYDLIK